MAKKAKHRGKGKGRPVKPVLQALLLADQVYEDRDTGKSIIAGTFDALFATVFPTVFNRHVFAFFSLTGIHGQVPIFLRYVDLSNDEVLLECGPISIQVTDPLESISRSVPVPPIPMPHAGGFAFEIHSCDELLGSLRVTVSLVEDDANEGDE